MTASHVAFVFLDGVGLGPPAPGGDEAANPLAVHRPALSDLAGGAAWTSDARRVERPDHVFIPLDATLGVPGLPQSGTGQAALFGGFDAAGLFGRHFGPHPPSPVRPVLAESNVFSRLVGSGTPVEDLAFANPFPERYFRYAEAHGRWTATTFSCISAGVRLRTGDDLRSGRAVPADFTGALWPEADAPPSISPSAAGRRLGEMARDHRFVLFECWITDKAGHSRDHARAAAVLDDLDGFLGGLVDSVDLSTTLILLSSDHGNLEDLTTKTHTLNPVPLLALGAGAGAFREARTIADVVPVLVHEG
jgi:hypothetical protein